ncbi:MAG: pyridoxamine 5'-phosphate oxidase family protein, partial [Pseudomonadota bacterium]
MSSEPITAPSPFHAGERQVQAKLGVSDIEDWARKVVRPYLPDQHREFYAKLPFLVAAARDDQGRPWVTLLAGREGFVETPDDRTLVIDAKPVPGDALEGALAEEVDLGLLGIEFATRRRNRVNGRISANRAGLTVSVDQSFGNCPQYIRERAWHWVEDPDAGEPLIGTALTAEQSEWIGKADTFFIASGHRDEGENPAFGMDASHRGGDPGFVVAETANRLVFPDYAGNNHYNTIGNLVLDPRVGLLFVDFETGSLLQLSGRAEIDWDSAARANFPGARRLVRIDIEAVIELPRALPLRWDSEAESVRSLRVVDKVRESADVTSFLFEARDGGLLTPFEAGQHLPIELHVTGHEEPVRRTYSLSGAPNAGRYRLSVKREERGAASRHLHDAVEVGEIIDARQPSGDFVLPCTHCPIV